MDVSATTVFVSKYTAQAEEIPEKRCTLGLDILSCSAYHASRIPNLMDAKSGSYEWSPGEVLMDVDAVQQLSRYVRGR